ncbi:MAG: hypothetical protein HUJ73_01415, partial [Eubacterium sp.]|nr:hypothetical protein [Eubacterium sp.]
NRKKAARPVLRRLSDILSLPSEDVWDQESPLYMLTDSCDLFGAVCIADPDTLLAAAEALGRSYYILPSSVHECLLLPDTGDYSVRELNHMVREVNSTQLEEGDILADHVYRYDYERRELVICMEQA